MIAFCICEAAIDAFACPNENEMRRLTMATCGVGCRGRSKRLFGNRIVGDVDPEVALSLVAKTLARCRNGRGKPTYAESRV